MTTEATEVTEPMIPRVGCYLGTVQLGGYPDGLSLLNHVVNYGRKIDKATARMLARTMVSPKEKSLDLYVVAGKDLGIPDDVYYPLDRVYSLAHGHGFELCPNEVAAHVSLHFNGLRPALIASSAVTPDKFFVSGNTLSTLMVEKGGEILFTSDCIAIFAHSRPGHS